MILYDILLAVHFIGLALGMGTGFSMMTLGMASADMEPAERGKFMLRASALSRNGSIGLTLLIVTGLWLLFGKWGGMEFLKIGPKTFHIKLTLVIVAMGLLGAMQVVGKKARQGAGTPEGAAALIRTGKLGGVMMVTTLTIVILAALTFH